MPQCWQAAWLRGVADAARLRAHSCSWPGSWKRSPTSTGTGRACRLHLWSQPNPTRWSLCMPSWVWITSKWSYAQQRAIMAYQLKVDQGRHENKGEDGNHGILLIIIIFTIIIIAFIIINSVIVSAIVTIIMVIIIIVVLVTILIVVVIIIVVLVTIIIVVIIIIVVVVVVVVVIIIITIIIPITTTIVIVIIITTTTIIINIVMSPLPLSPSVPSLSLSSSSAPKTYRPSPPLS